MHYRHLPPEARVYACVSDALAAFWLVRADATLTVRVAVQGGKPQGCKPDVDPPEAWWLVFRAIRSGASDGALAPAAALEHVSAVIASALEDARHQYGEIVITIPWRGERMGEVNAVVNCVRRVSVPRPSPKCAAAVG